MAIGSKIKSAWAYKRGYKQPSHFNELRKQTRSPVNVWQLWLDWWFAGFISLTLNDSSHDHSADAPTLSQKYTLTINDCVHTHEVDSPVLSQKYNISTANTIHDHFADSIIFISSLPEIHIIGTIKETTELFGEIKDCKINGNVQNIVLLSGDIKD